jgi:hypothetical protein
MIKRQGTDLSSNLITKFYFDQNNIFYELFFVIVGGGVRSQLNQYQINYDGYNPISTTFTLKSSITISNPNHFFARACISKNSNYGFFVE